MFDFFVNFGVRFIWYHSRFSMALVPNTYSHLFKGNSPGMEEDAQKKNIKKGIIYICNKQVPLW